MEHKIFYFVKKKKKKKKKSQMISLWDLVVLSIEYRSDDVTTKHFFGFQCFGYLILSDILFQT